MKNSTTEELCLFVSHAIDTKLKQHVIDHVLALVDEEMAVVLIINTDIDPAALQIPADLSVRLHGCIVRENIGFDFAAWAHAYCLIEPNSFRRLYLINDSIVGPLDRQVYETLLQRIRDSKADVIGLTSNPDPHDHLQSYYLAFNQRVLRSPAFDSFMRSVVNMPLKQNVIDCYEIWLTPFLEKKGFQSAAIFPSVATQPPPNRNDTICNWQKLIEIGFPFVKTMILRDGRHAADVAKLIPDRYR